RARNRFETPPGRPTSSSIRASSPSSTSPADDRERDVRGPVGVVEETLGGGDEVARGCLGDRAAVVRVAVEPGGVGAGDPEGAAVAGEEAVAGCDEVDLDLVDTARLEQSLLVEAVAVAQAEDAVCEADRPPVGVDVDQSRREVGVAGGCRNVQGRR